MLSVGPKGWISKRQKKKLPDKKSRGFSCHHEIADTVNNIDKSRQNVYSMPVRRAKKVSVRFKAPPGSSGGFFLPAHEPL